MNTMILGPRCSAFDEFITSDTSKVGAAAGCYDANDCINSSSNTRRVVITDRVSCVAIGQAKTAVLMVWEQAAVQVTATGDSIGVMAPAGVTDHRDE